MSSRTSKPCCFDATLYRDSSASWCRSTRVTSSSVWFANTGRASRAALRCGNTSTSSLPICTVARGCDRRRADMVDLDFACTGAKPDPAAASPTILLRLHIDETTDAAVHALVLRCQIRIAPQRRRYNDAEAEGVRDLFGERARWGDSLNPIQLAFVNNVVPGFTGSTDIDLSLPCSYDFDVA